jgi:hypothetical protein
VFEPTNKIWAPRVTRTWEAIPLTPVSFDITPEKTPNCVNPTKKGTLTAAILGSATLNTNLINNGTMRIDDDDNPTTDGVAASKSSKSDVNRDGRQDLVLQFDTQLLNNAGLLVHGATLYVTAALSDGTMILGSDVIHLSGISPCQ